MNRHVGSADSAMREVSIPVERDGDVVIARKCGRELAERAGFNGTDLTLIATAISEIARNIVVYAGRGTISMQLATSGHRAGIAIRAEDEGPGIPDIDRAMQDGFSTGNSLGLGLSGARRLMDDFEIDSRVGEGTTISMNKWAR